MRRMISICLTWFPIGGLREPNIYHDLGDLTRIADFTWRVSDCEELVGVTKLNHDLNDTVSVFDLKQLPRDSQL